MARTPPELAMLLAKERWRVAELAALFSLPHVDYGALVYPGWSAKDVLGYIVFWHESFARNTRAVVSGEKPAPPKWSLSETNRISVEETRSASKARLLRRLDAAQATVERYINVDGLGLIPYRRGSRPYLPAEHLNVVENHVRDHQKHVLRALITRTIV